MNFIYNIKIVFYLSKGGINQHLISVVVEAYNTLVFNVYAYVYGV